MAAAHDVARARAERVRREERHGIEVLNAGENNWGWNTPAGRVRFARRVEYLVNVVSNPSAAVLEIGCGTGNFTEELARRFKRLVAIDISPDLLGVARRRVPSAHFAQMDAHDVAFPTGTFDAVVGCSVLHHLDWEMALRGLRRVLKPGGVIRFSEPNLANPQIFLQKTIPILKRWAGDSPDEYAFTCRQIRHALASTGFIALTVNPYEFLHPAIPNTAINIATRMERVIMRTPLRFCAGSILIEATKEL